MDPSLLEAELGGLGGESDGIGVDDALRVELVLRRLACVAIASGSRQRRKRRS